MFDQIESLKQQYTDKYVVVDETRPELARFRGLAGQIKTVNMSGRALVEFDAFNNIGWYDIDLDFLKVVDKPPPKPAEEHAKPAKAAAKPAAPKVKAESPAGEKKLSPLEMARAQGAAKKPGDAPKKSTSDILAAARAGKTAAPPKDALAGSVASTKAEAAPAAGVSGEKKKLSTAEIIAAAKAKKGAAPTAAESAPTAPAAPPASKPTTAEILAAARRKVSPPEETAAAPVAEAPPAAIEESPAKAPVAAVEKPVKSPPSGDVPKTTAEKIAWCRQHDAK
jgi:hypothetical protein